MANLQDARAGEIVAQVLGLEVRSVRRIVTGFGSANWRVGTEDGDVVLKVGPASSAAKWSSADHARQLAGGVGIPVPELLHAEVRDVGAVRVFRWVEGHVLSDVDDPGRLERVASELASAAAALHDVRRPVFTSRLDGSGPSFDAWAGYVRHRVGQIRDRAGAVDALDDAVLERVAEVAFRLADAVTSVVAATVCHRDLHPDNVVVRPDGGLAAILDWDMAEAWDPAGEWYRLDTMLLPHLGDAADTFRATYDRAHPDRPQWDERCRLVRVVEAANSVANAVVLGHDEYAARSKSVLEATLD
ncbi:MAG: aminoglycoside phosphotransferase family protein [Actinobacteria bacterium]|nr:aminoglycoside phosphotransferase family protein [Actinomycetota bacterium]